MAQVVIRNLDSAVVDRLKTRAKRNRRSLEAELRNLLTEAADERSRLIDWLDNHAIYVSKDLDVTAMIREDRDAR